MAFPFQFIFTTFLSVLLAICDGSNVRRFYGELIDTFKTALLCFDTLSFCDGECYVVETFIFYSFHDYVAHTYIQSTGVCYFTLCFYFYIRYSESDYRVLT
jgi:hypothetical protein